jgi:hypothetical protein
MLGWPESTGRPAFLRRDCMACGERRDGDKSNVKSVKATD